MARTRDAAGPDDSLWYACVVDRLLLRIGRTRLVGDNHLILLSVLAIGCFAVPVRPWGPAAGAACYLLSTIHERRDDLRQHHTNLGALRDLGCALALFLGQYVLTGHAIHLRLGIGVLTLLAYEQLRRTRPTLVRPVEEASDDEEFLWWDWYSWFQRLERAAFADRDTPVRPYGPVEFRLTVFVIAPLAHGYAVALLAIGGVLLLVTEATGIVSTFRAKDDDAPQTAVHVPEARRETAPDAARRDRRTALSEVGSK